MIYTAGLSIDLIIPSLNLTSATSFLITIIITDTYKEINLPNVSVSKTYAQSNIPKKMNMNQITALQITEKRSTDDIHSLSTLLGTPVHLFIHVII